MVKGLTIAILQRLFVFFFNIAISQVKSMILNKIIEFKNVIFKKSQFVECIFKSQTKLYAS
jgi:hypothetical protein